MHRALGGLGEDDFLAALVAEQIDAVGGVVPQQMIGPGARPAGGVDVFAAEKIGLDIHLLDRQFAGADFVMHPLVRRIEAPRMADHAGEPGLLLLFIDRFGIGPAIGERDFHLHMLARLHALDRLGGVHLGRRRQDYRFDAGLADGFRQVRGDVPNTVFVGNLLGLFQAPPDARHHLVAVDAGDAVKMFLAERAGPGERYFHGNSSNKFGSVKLGFPI